MAKKARKATTFKEKVEAEFPEFVHSMWTLSVVDLEKRLSDYAKGRADTKEAKKVDVELEEARKVVTELSAPYNETLNAIEKKSKYIVELIREKGGQ